MSIFDGCLDENPAPTGAMDGIFDDLASVFTGSSSTKPKADRATYNDPATVLSVQQSLKARGYDPGPLDGKWGPKTAAAIQQAMGGEHDGKIGDEVLTKLAVPKGGYPGTAGTLASGVGGSGMGTGGMIAAGAAIAVGAGLLLGGRKGGGGGGGRRSAPRRRRRRR